MSKTVLIIDALNMFIRNYVVNPTLDRHGNPIGGCVGFIKSLQKVCKKFEPNEVVVVWDGHQGSQRKRSINKNYKEGRKPIRFNRRLIDLNPEEQDKNKAYQLIRLMEYLNEFPIIQLTVDYTEADDIIAFVSQHEMYGFYNKIIISSDKDFFQLCNETTSVYRPIQDKIVGKQDILEEFKIHPVNFALARAIAGDPSDNLHGVAGVGLKTVAKRFPFLYNEEEYDCETIIKNCLSTRKKLKLHENIIKSEQLVKNNYKIMQLYYPNIRPINRIFINNSLSQFEADFSKLNFTKMLFQDDLSYINFEELIRIMKNINRR
jgi:5'-3' exonuclease